MAGFIVGLINRLMYWWGDQSIDELGDCLTDRFIGGLTYW
jgi:hypothetical protein